MASLQEATRERAIARVGTTLNGKWRLDALIAVGGAAAVYRGIHRNGHRAAVKVLHPELARDRDFVQRFLREGYAANQVGHPGAVKVLDDNATPDGTHYLVMELLEGESLERLLGRIGPLDESFVLWVADQVLPVLAAAHDKGIVHRDIKPENLFYSTARDVRVLDFGVARFRDPAYGVAMTTSRHVMGTPAYMPPEQARGRWEQVDGTTDLWALGATMYALLTGRLPREARSRTEELMLAMTVPLPTMERLVPGLSADVVAIMDRALAFDRTRRFPNAMAMHEAVKEALATRGLRGPVAPMHAYRHATVPTSGEVSTLHALPAVGGAPSIEPVSSSPLLPDDDRSSREITTAKLARRPRQARLLGAIALSASAAAVMGACLAVRPWSSRPTSTPTTSAVFAPSTAPMASSGPEPAAVASAAAAPSAASTPLADPPPDALRAAAPAEASAPKASVDAAAAPAGAARPVVARPKLPRRRPGAAPPAVRRAPGGPASDPLLRHH